MAISVLNLSGSISKDAPSSRACVLGGEENKLEVTGHVCVKTMCLASKIEQKNKLKQVLILCAFLVTDLLHA